MLRAVSSIYIESQALELFATSRRDVFKLFRTSWFSTAAHPSQTVLKSAVSSAGTVEACPAPRGGAPPPPPPPPPPPRPPRRAWTVGAAALALTASVGGVYYYRKISDEKTTKVIEAPPPPRWPARGALLPPRVQYLLVGAGTASFAAMRAIRSLQPEAQVLMVGSEPTFPYMRPPLSKELWREPALSHAAAGSLTFAQWNGRRRALAYEPPAFYVPAEKLQDSERGGASVARGWRVTSLDVERHEATLEAPGEAPVTIHYEKALIATGVRPRRVECLRSAAAAGRSLPLRTAHDAQALAAALDDPQLRSVAVLGGGFLATELSAALADRLRGTGKTVTQVYREEAPLAAVLPRYLALEAARRLRGAGAALRGGGALRAAEVREGGVTLRLEGGDLHVDLVVECVGSEVDDSLALASDLETHPTLGGLLVNAELQARSDVYVAGDAACFYDVVLGRRRVEHHDHAVVSGRLAGENMTSREARHYTHQSMFWSDLGPHLGYEAIGIIDSSLPTVGVFSAEAVTDEHEHAHAPSVLAHSGGAELAGGEGAPGGDADEKRYSRGVVFYTRERRVVGVLLWNLFNRMHVARRVLAQGYFDDLFEVAKLFDLHEDE